MIFSIHNLGCAKNQVDAEILIDELESKSWTFTRDFSKANIILVNSCGFIDPAKEESIEDSLALVRDYPHADIFMTGCLSERYKKDLQKSLPEIKGFYGNRNLRQITQFMTNQGYELVPSNKKPNSQSEVQISDHEARGNFASKLADFPGFAYVKIAEGCQHACTYCAIPLIRGSLRSTPKQIILRDIEKYLSKNIFEINLIAQDLSSYQFDLNRSYGEIASLIEEILMLKSNFWLRLLYLYPERFPLELVRLSVKEKKLLPYFDIPIQHGSDDILKKMGRSLRKESIISLVSNIRAINPQAVVRTSIIVGFPGESENDFDILFNLIKELQFDWLGVFVYSQEEGTAAAQFPNQVPEKIALERKKHLEELQVSISSTRLERFLETEQIILIEELVAQENLALGRIYAQAPEVDGLTVLSYPPNSAPLAGNSYKCRINAVNGIDLAASLIE